MITKHRWLYEAYLALVLVFATIKVYYLFAPDSPEAFFYLLLRTFDPKYYLHHIAHMMHVTLNFIHCLPLIFAIYRIRFIPPNFWKFLFILRCIFELTGQTYQMNTIEALYHSNFKLLIFFCAFLIIPQIPSYVICYYYAFRQEKIFK